jgi:transcriptional regulator NrdR family protein
VRLLIFDYRFTFVKQKKIRHGKLIVDQNENLNGILEEARFYSLENLILLIENELINREQKQVKDEKTLIEKIVTALSEIRNDLSNEQFTLNRRHVMQSLMQTKSEAYLRFQSINLKGADLRLDLSF